MPLLVPCQELEPGMRLFEPIVWHGRVMLPAGRELSDLDVRALGEKFPEMVVRVGSPVLDDIIDFEDDSQDRRVAGEIQNKVAESLGEVSKRFAARSSLAKVDFSAIHESVKEIMGFLKENHVTAALMNKCLGGDGYLGTHGGNVFYLTMLLGSVLAGYVAQERNRQTRARALRNDFAMDLTPLGLGAMLIDVGMLPLAKLYTLNRPLSEAERETVRQHPTAGADMLPESVSAVARMTVRTHHENMDGSGYPNQMPAAKLHVFTRIIRIADAFDAATSDNAFSQAKSPARVLWEMTVGPFSRYYDPALMKVFGKLIQPFSIGSKLRLHDGRHAVVVRFNRTDPFLPTVVVAFDANNKRLDESEMEGPFCLEKRDDLRIKSYMGEDLSYIYKKHDAPEPAPANTSFDSLFATAYP